MKNALLILLIYLYLYNYLFLNKLKAMYVLSIMVNETLRYHTLLLRRWYQLVCQKMPHFSSFHGWTTTQGISYWVDPISYFRDIFICYFRTLILKFLGVLHVLALRNINVFDAAFPNQVICQISRQSTFIYITQCKKIPQISKILILCLVRSV